ncbi:hypothetical protein M3Y98_00562200 [Aphelenchoides besseyi]|nr:hypothetical protein M3Y98_00562200 [Aphelenchoides besseyi]
MWEKCRTGESFIKATRVEAYTMNEFYRACGLIEYEQHHTDFEKLFCTELLFIWMLIEIIFATRAHGGFRSRKVYLFDDSYLSVNEDALYEFYRSHKHVKNDHERVVIMFICLFNKITRAFGPQAKLEMWKSQLFTDLSAYYTQTYSNTAIRFGQLMDCIAAIENTHVHQVHQLSIVRLDYKSKDDYGYDIYSAQVFGD